MSPTAVPPYTGTLLPPVSAYQQPQYPMYQNTGPPQIQPGYGMYGSNSPGLPVQNSPPDQQLTPHPAAYGSYSTEPVEVGIVSYKYKFESCGVCRNFHTVKPV